MLTIQLMEVEEVSLPFSQAFFLRIRRQWLWHGIRAGDGDCGDETEREQSCEEKFGCGRHVDGALLLMERLSREVELGLLKCFWFMTLNRLFTLEVSR